MQTRISRYPDGFPAGAPFEMFTTGQAERALHSAECVYQTIFRQISDANHSCEEQTIIIYVV